MGEEYFITFIDAYSHFGFVCLIKEKSNTLNVSKIFKAKQKSNQIKKKNLSLEIQYGEYYGRYIESGRNPGPFARFFEKDGIVS